MTAPDSRLAACLLLFVFSATGIGIVVTGCDDPRRSEETQDPSTITYESQRGYGSPPGDSRTRDNFDIERAADESTRFIEAVKTASTWREAHRRVQDRLGSPSPVAQFLREQEAAYLMFEVYLDTDRWRAEWSEEKADVLGFYTDLLVKNRSPESGVIYPALNQLEPHWSDERLIDAAETTIEAATRKYDSRTNASALEDTTTESDEPTPNASDGFEFHSTRVLRFNRKLQHLIERLRTDR